MKTFRFRGVTAVLVAIAATAGLTLAAPVASAATARAATVKVAAVTPATACVGGNDVGPIWSSNGLASLQFWWTQESASTICIGTVVYTEYVTKQTGLSLRVRIWDEPSNFLLSAYWGGGKIISNGITFSKEIRLVQPTGLAMVCAEVVTGGDGSNNVRTDIPDICKTVGA